jgi:Undecaprenyl-phosphate glucose phosphotransferase
MGAIHTTAPSHGTGQRAARVARPAAEPALRLATPEPEASPTPAQATTRRAPLDRAALLWAARALEGAVAALVVLIALAVVGIDPLEARTRDILPFALAPLVVMWGVAAAEGYRFALTEGALAHVGRTMLGACLALLALGIASVALRLGPDPLTVAGVLTAVWLGAVGLHGHYVAIVKGLTRAGRLAETVVIVGATDNAARLIERNAKDRALNILGVFDDRLSRAPKALGDIPVLGRIDDLLGFDRLPEVDRIIVTVTSTAQHRVRTLIDQLRHLPQQVVLLLDLDGFNPEATSLAQIANAPAAYVSGAPRDARRAAVKRVSDIVFSILMLIAFAPVMAITALLIKLDSPGPVFFRQDRHGFNNQVIRVWKFRSMRPDARAEKGIIDQVKAGDARVTQVGRVIRKTSIDELPQLWNVLKGEMSLVGPRPHAVHMTTDEDQSTEVHRLVSDYAHRHRVKPGLTGWAQINGSRGPVRTKAEMEERIRLDIEYVNRAGFWFDIYVMVMTAPCLLGDACRDR